MSNGSYQSIAEYYDDIFQLDDAQKRFIKHRLISADLQNVLDIGCGTGELALFLAGTGARVVGTDLDRKMIRLAEQKKKLSGCKNIQFRTADMTKLKTAFPLKKFDAVICMGNTLVHLPSLDMIEHFFRSVHSVLKPDGLFVFQIMNYEKIIKSGQSSLPLIENERIKFKRTYAPIPAKKRIAFQMELTVKKTDTTILSIAELVPATFGELQPLWSQTGFFSEKIFGGFDESSYHDDSGLLICMLKKRTPQNS